MRDTAAATASDNGEVWSEERRLGELRRRRRQHIRLITNRHTGAETVAYVEYAPGGHWSPTSDFLDAVALVHRELSRQPDLLSFQMVFRPPSGGAL